MATKMQNVLVKLNPSISSKRIRDNKKVELFIKIMKYRTQPSIVMGPLKLGMVFSCLFVCLASIASGQTFEKQHATTLQLANGGTSPVNYLTITAPTLGSNPTIVLPSVNDTFPAANASGYLLNDGTGGLSWSAAAASVSLTNSGGLTFSPSPITGTGTIGLDLTHTNVWTAPIYELQAGIASTYTNGLILENTTASTSTTTVQQSPSLEFISHAWSTTATAADSTREWTITDVPVSSANPIVSNLTFQSGSSATDMVTQAQLSNNGTLTLGKAATTTGSLALANSTGSTVLTTIQGGAATTALTYVLPAATSVPVAGQVLSVASVSGNTVQLQWGTSSASYARVTTSPISTAELTTTSEMAGLQATDTTFKPKVTGNMLIIVSGNITTYANGGSGTIQVEYGTGGGPAHGAAQPGNFVGNVGPAATVQPISAGHTELAPFCIAGYVSGLTVGQSYWVDGLMSFSASGVAATNVVISVTELP